MNLLRKLWDAVPVRASRYKRLAWEADNLQRSLYDAKAALSQEKIRATSAEQERDRFRTDAAEFSDRCLTMQRQHAERMRAEFQRFGGEPKVRQVPRGTRAWEYIIPQDDPVVRFYEPGATPKFEDCRYKTERVEMREVGVRVAIGLPTHVPPEAVAIKIGQEITDAVLRTWRGQSALLREGGR